MTGRRTYHRLGIWLIVTGLLMASCRRHTIDRTLAAADALMEQNADSAYALLQQITDVTDRDDVAMRARYTLLLTQAAYKLYKPVPSDSLIRSAVGYYEQAADRPMLCRAYYYHAMTLYERDRHDEALLILKKGEHLARDLNDQLQLSKYYESLCMVNDYAHSDDLMLEYAKLFLNNAFQLKDTVLIARGYCHVSTAYARLGNQQQDRKFILKTLPLLQQLDSVARSYILTNIACTLHKQGYTLEAKPSTKYYVERK